jgi:hypothetical protein
VNCNFSRHAIYYTSLKVSPTNGKTIARLFTRLFLDLHSRDFTRRFPQSVYPCLFLMYILSPDSNLLFNLLVPTLVHRHFTLILQSHTHTPSLESLFPWLHKSAFQSHFPCLNPPLFSISNPVTLSVLKGQGIKYSDNNYTIEIPKSRTISIPHISLHYCDCSSPYFMYYSQNSFLGHVGGFVSLRG